MRSTTSVLTGFVCVLTLAIQGCVQWPVKDAGDPETERAIDEALATMTRSEQRRLLRFINTARSPEDLTRFPQEMRLEFEHGMPGVVQEQRQLNLDPALYDGENVAEAHGYRIPAIDFDTKLATDVLTQRPLNGFRDLRDILRIDWGRWKDIIDRFSPFFGPRVYGRWVELDGGTGRPIMHAALLRTGKVLMMPSSTETVLWDPSSGVEVLSGATTGLTADLFCSGHSFLADGTLLAVGGGGGSIGAASSNQGWKFNPVTERWTRTAGDMHHLRWYPTTVTLADRAGQVLVASGWRESARDPAPQMEMYNPVTDSFQLVTASGPVGEKVFNQTYPGLHLTRRAEIFYAPAGFGNCTQSQDPFEDTEESGIFTRTTALGGTWRNTGHNVRTKGMSVLVLRNESPVAQVVTFGGGDLSASGTARSIDVTSAAPSWELEFPMLEHRVHPNAVLLPDGSVFVSGGMAETSPTPPNGGRSEMYDPDTGAILEMDDLNRPRHYHSVALLLPSGQVMTAGGADSDGCSLSVENTIEIFSPPYLFRGRRPVIHSAPDRVRHGNTFPVRTSAAGDINKVVLVRPMAVTHQTDSEQRVIHMEFDRIGEDELEVTAPMGNTPQSISPLGYYMLFILNNRGVPSEAKFIRLVSEG